MSRRLDRLRDTCVHLLLGLGVLGVVALMATDWGPPEAIQVSLDEHMRVCPVCQVAPQGPLDPQPRHGMVALQEGRRVVRDAIGTDPAR
jgi:hypothetical protein